MTTTTPVSIDGRPWHQGMAIYHDPEVDEDIITNSMIKSFRKCPMAFNYNYVQRLRPQILGRPLRFGTWMHELYEEFHKGGDWEAIHKRNCIKFSKYFDEEKDSLGDLPRDCYRTMISYIWHYKADEWKVHETEFIVEARLPDGTLFRCKIDMLIENQYGLWIVDHKNHKKIPGLDFRMLDIQSALYVWAALKAGIPVQGHIWNYVRSTPPSEPELLKNGTALSRAKKIVTDYPHLVRAIKKYKLNPADYAEKLAYLKAQRYQPGELQTSPFFQREVLEKSPALLKRVATEAFWTHKRIMDYHWDRPEAIERNVGGHCTFMCSFTEICTAELTGANTAHLRRHNFKPGDPMDYYNDSDQPGKGETR